MTQLLNVVHLEIDGRFSVGFMIGTFAGILTNCWLRPVAEDNRNNTKYGYIFRKNSSYKGE